MTAKQQTLVKARKASRITGALLIFGGCVLLVMGISILSLPEVLDGVVMMASSSLLFVVANKIEKKINALGG